ncbi:MAG: hypothetical protein H7A37_06900 [Chlamydiales bacterium]|nr:hypothetical protein [Chlamydiia bacterium]MCP5508010.1 hypothetical protein [Chlamydiales bacterium]
MNLLINTQQSELVYVIITHDLCSGDECDHHNLNNKSIRQIVINSTNYDPRDRSPITVCKVDFNSKGIVKSAYVGLSAKSLASLNRWVFDTKKIKDPHNIAANIKPDRDLEEFSILEALFYEAWRQSETIPDQPGR